LARVHHLIRVGGVLDVTVFAGDDGTTGCGISGTDFPDDELPGRLFTWWRPEDLGRLLVGAGFGLQPVLGGGRQRDELARNRAPPRPGDAEAALPPDPHQLRRRCRRWLPTAREPRPADGGGRGTGVGQPAP